MRKQFLRFYIGLFAVFSLAALIFFLAILKEVETVEDQKVAALMKPLVIMIQDEMRESFGDPIVLDTLLDKLNENSILTFHIAKMNENYLNKKDIQDIYNGKVVGLSDKRSRSVFSLLPGGNVVHIGLIPLDRKTKTVYLAMFPPFLILLLIGSVIYLLIRPIERQILELSEATHSFGTGNLQSRAKIIGKSAMNELALVFNSMSDRIERLVRGQRELLHAVSHDFRTPLSRIFFNMDNAFSATTLEEKNNELKKMDQSLSNLNDLVQELLEYIRLEEQQNVQPDQELMLDPIFDEMLEMGSELRPEVNISILCSSPAAYATPRDIRRILENLLTNGLRHANREIIVNCSREGKHFRLTVEDDGAGIPMKEWENIFTPFYRLDQSRNLQLGGSGLGLAIVSRIMEKLGGTVTVTDSSLGGARFDLEFPNP